ncbi:mitochondrial substrate carrier family protein C [Iris pallida]|uniref:Mitochondrial substrate carrier family protein C n=1 Tax=Iris pallida TaxID=29817 RepID=A0AAX6GR71_IRIPA|nr:mitochondrial substrate carrier family protein C [Iris pallida]
MVSCADPLESFLRSVKDVISPLESGFSRFSRDLESHWCNNNSGGSRNGAGSVDFFAIGLPMKKREASASSAVVTASGERKRGFKSLLGSMSPNSKKKRGEREEGEEEEKRDESCSNCLGFAVGWSLFLNNFVQGFPTPFKSVKKCFGSDAKAKQKHKSKKSSGMNGEISSLELLLCLALDNLVQNLQMFDHMKIVSGMIKGRQADVNGLLANIKFARVGGAPASLVDAAATGGTVNDHVETRITTKDKGVDKVEGEAETAQKTSTRTTTKDKNVDKVQAEGGTAQKIVGGLLDIPLSNVERWKSTISTVSLMELIESIPQLGGKSSSSKEHPDKKKLFSVQDFFRYTESEGRRFFEELDRDGDGQVTLEDLEIAMRNRKLPMRYARDLMRRTKSNLFSKSIGWKQFLSFMEQKEPTILRAYTTLCLSKSGTLKKNQVLTSLKSAGLPANEDNAAAMMRYLNANTGGSISYSHFRNFMLLLPSDRLEDDPRNVWFEAATVVAVPPPVEISAENVLKSALAGGLASALSTSLLHPIDSIKANLPLSNQKSLHEYKLHLLPSQKLCLRFHR